MGAYAIEAAQALHAQLATPYLSRGPAQTAAQLWARVGVTPMIGLNDVITETFELEDRQQVVDFADANTLDLVSMRSLDRDHPGPDSTCVELTCSSRAHQTLRCEFSAIGSGWGR